MRDNTERDDRQYAERMGGGRNWLSILSDKMSLYSNCGLYCQRGYCDSIKMSRKINNLTQAWTIGWWCVLLILILRHTAIHSHYLIVHFITLPQKEWLLPWTNLKLEFYNKSAVNFLGGTKQVLKSKLDEFCFIEDQEHWTSRRLVTYIL